MKKDQTMMHDKKKKNLKACKPGPKGCKGAKFFMCLKQTTYTNKIYKTQNSFIYFSDFCLNETFCKHAKATKCPSWQRHATLTIQ